MQAAIDLPHHKVFPSDNESSGSPVGGGSASICSSHDLVQGLEGLFSAALSRTYSEPQADNDYSDLLQSNETERSSTTFERCRILRQELGEGEGVSVLLAKASKNKAEGGTGCLTASETEDWAPSSPGLRQTTFGATLDFVDALCDASSHLVQLPQDTRLKALKRALMDINSEIDLCNANGLAVWFPMGCKNQRVLRLVPDEAILLNSREKAPFLLLIEVQDMSVEGNETDEESMLYGDSAESLQRDRRKGSSSGVGPFAVKADVSKSEGSQAECSKNSFSK